MAPIAFQFFPAGSNVPGYDGDGLVCWHGSWNRSSKLGYRIMLVRLDASGRQARSYEPFAEGWLQGQRPWGRPVCLLVLPDGSLLVSDDQNDAVYRISYKG